jgi:hypothetical protein
MLKPGDDIDSWCGVCKRILAHTIEAVVSEVPARVHCNTCQAQHRYRPSAPQEKGPGRVTRARTSRPRESEYEKCLRGKDRSLAMPYSPKGSYAVDDLVKHPKFGIGVTMVVRGGDKIDVAFESGTRTLVQGR